MSTHKITAGHGYTYLTRQTMAHDGAAVTADGLGGYYSEHGEAPGRWLGSGLAGLGIDAGVRVSEQQMIALFGEGRHPDAVEITARLRAEGHSAEVAAAAAELGTPFALNNEANEFRRQVAQLAGEWNVANGRPACAPAPAWLLARIRTAVGSAMFAKAHDREPADARELADFIAHASRLGSKAVAGFDLTFSPVKSVSALWALAPEPVATQIEAAHHAAVADTIGWLERSATFTRLGRNGVRQVETRGLIAAAFVHRASRAGDPDLHTHVAVSNKVQTLDGRWRALDGRVLFKATVAASERYNTRLEAELRDRLGVQFVERGREGKRPVREIAGVDERLLSAWSRRRSAIDARRAALSAVFQREHGRPPTPVEAIALAQQATLETRRAKPAPADRSTQRAAWHAEAIATLGERGLDELLTGALTRHPSGAAGVPVTEVAGAVIERVQADRATWQRWHVVAEAQRAVRTLNLPLAHLDQVVEQVVGLALAEHSVELSGPDRIAEPEALRRADGTSVYTVAGSQLYSSQAVLDAERGVLAAAADRAQCYADPATVEIAVLEAVANGLQLNDDQVNLIRSMASSGARLQLALAPAGTGKTTALQVLARVWIEGGGTVHPLAPSAAAARVLGEATGLRGETLAKALLDLDAGRLRLDKFSLLLVDEAGMASTLDLARLTAHATAAGASVRLVGDDRQLAAVGAGGLLRDLAHDRNTVSLGTAVRFTDPAEAEAALGIRDGAAEALDFYLEHFRVHAGDEHTGADSAYRAWAADRAAGRDALLLAATRAQVAALNTQARAARLAATGSRVGPEVRLADGCAASAGDAIITRHNARSLRITATDWVKNGDRFTVDRVLDTGALHVTHHATGRHITLPADYVGAHVDLGYATTIHGAQGRTADTCHTVITGSETREQLYVALSRGRHANHLHVALPGAADEHAPVRSDTLAPPGAADLVRRVLEREGASRSASTERKVPVHPVRQLREAVARYADAAGTAPATPGAAAARPAPLPWLPPVPQCADEAWTGYLAARATQIESLASHITAQMQASLMISTVFNQADRYLHANDELWAATHPDGHTSELTRREQLYLRHLRDRHGAIGKDRHVDDRQRWLPLVAAVDREAVTSPHYPELARALTDAFAQRFDVDAMLPGLLHGRDYARAVTTLDQQTEGRRQLRATIAAQTVAPAFPKAQWVDPLHHELSRGHEL